MTNNNLIVKWVGGKTRMLNELISMVPENYGTYYEPFFGGGALFFALAPEYAVVNDINEQLMNVYQVLVDDPVGLMFELNDMELNHSINPEHFYYSAREVFNDGIKDGYIGTEMAALFIYLNKAGFNGLYRVNKDGLFNVPSGHKAKVNTYSAKTFGYASNLLTNAQITFGDFEEACWTAECGDFVYFDPPYFQLNQPYTASAFDTDEHERLYNLFKQLTEKGVYCMLTCNNHEYTRNLYQGFNLKTVSSVYRMRHTQAEELIITNY